MKRFLSLLTVFMLAFIMAVPAFASSPMISYNGELLPDIETVWEDKPSWPVAFIEKMGSSYRLRLFSNSDLNCSKSTVYMLNPVNSVTERFYVLSDDGWTFISESEKNSDVTVITSDIFVWTNHSFSYGSEVVFPASEPVEPVCDGSACPATDANADGICDDCGMMLSLRSLTYPAFPSVDGSNKHYALVKTKYSGVDAYMYSVFTGDVTYDIRGETPSTVYQIAVDGVADYIQYVTTDGQTWVEIQNSSVNNQSVGSGIVSQTTVIASTFDWYNEEGERFFPVPLWEEVQTVTQGEMGNLTAETVGTLKVLVPCGVGLMACLVALSLFGKRSLISLR